MASIPISNTWVDINTEAAINVGVPLSMFNKGYASVVVKESVSQPGIDDLGDYTISNIHYPYAIGVATKDSLRVWARCTGALGSTLTVKERC